MGRGRPMKDSKEKKSESYRIRLTKKDKRMLDTAAKDLGYSRSKLIRESLGWYYDARLGINWQKQFKE